MIAVLQGREELILFEQNSQLQQQTDIKEERLLSACTIQSAGTVVATRAVFSRSARSILALTWSLRRFSWGQCIRRGGIGTRTLNCSHGAS